MSYRVALSPPAPSRHGPDDSRERGAFGVRTHVEPVPLPRHYVIGRGRWHLRLGGIAFWGTMMFVLAMALWSIATITYFAFREDVLTGLIARQADMQHAYEDRIAEMRAHVDRLNARQLLDQEQVEKRVALLARRQSALETRASLLSTLPSTPGAPATTGSVAAERPAAAPPKPSPINDTVIIAPARDRRAQLESRVAPRRAAQIAPAQGAVATLTRIEESLDRVEARQSAVLLALEDQFTGSARRMKSVLADLGIDIAKRAPQAPRGGVGGPFIPVDLRDGGPFERQLQRVHIAREQVERLQSLLVTVPIRRPLSGETDTSSGFGVRLDPFLRAPAMHSGIDFRAPPGTSVHATAAGQVVGASWSGGYGRMVEIDHGDGLTTRYAHLSEILVREGQTVRPGQLIGRVGSTGRSTGPHLHYETRIDGDAVDPHKFLRAGLRITDKN